MALGTAERAWTYDEYVEKYDKLKAKNNVLKAVLSEAKDTINALAKMPPFTAYMSHNLGRINAYIEQVLKVGSQ